MKGKKSTAQKKTKIMYNDQYFHKSEQVNEELSMNSYESKLFLIIVPPDQQGIRMWLDGRLRCGLR